MTEPEHTWAGGLSTADVERLVEYLVAKHARWGHWGLTDEQWLEGVVATTVADTLLVVGDGPLTVDNLKPEPPPLLEADPTWMDSVVGGGPALSLRERWRAWRQR